MLRGMRRRRFHIFVFVFVPLPGHRSWLNIEGQNPLYDSVYLDLGTNFFHRVVRNHAFDDTVPEAP